MIHRCRVSLLLATVLLAAGCVSALRWTPEYHEVREGETLYSIAWRYGLDYRRLAAWNQLGDGDLIVPGQRLRLRPPDTPVAASGARSPRTESTQPARGSGAETARPPPVRQVSGWRWPVSGPVMTGFGATPETASGIEIATEQGEAVRAAAAGEVVYAGSGMTGYRQLVIVKHNDNFLSAYGHNEELLVAEGARVSAGQVIGRAGLGRNRRSMLYFEIRRNGQPVDPAAYLPRR